MSSLKDWYRYVDSKARSRREGEPAEPEPAADQGADPPARAAEDAAPGAVPPSGRAPSPAAGAQGSAPGDAATGDEELDIWSGLFPQRRQPEPKPATAPLKRPAVRLDEVPADLSFDPAAQPSAPQFPLPEAQVEIPRFDAFVSPTSTEPPPAATVGPLPGAAMTPAPEAPSVAAPSIRSADGHPLPDSADGNPTAGVEAGAPPGPTRQAGAPPAAVGETAPETSLSAPAAGAASRLDPDTPASVQEAPATPMPTPGETPDRAPSILAATDEAARLPVTDGEVAPLSSASASLDSAPDFAPRPEAPAPPPPAVDTPTGEPAAADTPAVEGEGPATDENSIPWRSPFELPGRGRTISSGASAPRPEPAQPRASLAGEPSGSHATGSAMPSAPGGSSTVGDPPTAAPAPRPVPGTEAWERERVERLARTFRETLQVLEGSLGAPSAERRRPVVPPIHTWPAAPEALTAPEPATPAVEAPPVGLADPTPPASPAASDAVEATSAPPPAPFAPAVFNVPDAREERDAWAAPVSSLADTDAVGAEERDAPVLAGTAVDTVAWVPPVVEPTPAPAMFAPDTAAPSPALIPDEAADEGATTATSPIAEASLTPGPARPLPPSPADVLRSIEEAALIRQRLPQHIAMLLRIPTNEVAQNSYKSPFRESREQLIGRLLDPQLTLEEAARILGVCPTTVRRYTNRGMLHCHRTPGNQRRFRMSDVLQFLEQFGDRIDRAAETKQYEEAA